MSIAATARPWRCWEATAKTVNRRPRPGKYGLYIDHECALDRGHVGEHWDGWGHR